MTFFRAY